MLLADLSKFNQNRNNIHPIFRKFYLIKDAVSLSERNGKLPIFSCDKPNSKIKGAKLFYTASYERFWMFYSMLKDTERCFYETLLPDLLSHLYADIEGCKITNKDVDFEKLYLELIENLKTFMIKILGIDENDIRIIELDSSTDKKFSKHCIIKIKDCYFKNNFHCGAFMRRFQKSIIEDHGLPQEDNKYFIWSDKEKDFEDKTLKIFFVDLGVYTLRRQFRLLGSSKRSEVRRYMWLKDKKNQLVKEDFFDCLIQYVPPKSKIKNIYEVMEIDGSEPYSRSLKTFDEKGNPISIAQNGGSGGGERQPILDIREMHLKKLKKQLDDSGGGEKRKLAILPVAVQQSLQKYYHKKYNYTIKSYVVSEEKIKLETYDTHCFIRQQITGDPNHTSNHIYLILYLNSHLTFQGCYNENVCKQKGKKLLHDLGKIDVSIEEGKELVDSLQVWQSTLIKKNNQMGTWIPIKRKKRKTI